ncbi:MAG: DUF2590 family protein [Deltaproteobacteria bacterium]|nr:DUF2590 family protein [Deltaproteobacteria bacterium]
MKIADLYDLKIENNDLVFGLDDEPIFFSELAVVEQDLTSRVRESGMAAGLLRTGGATASDLRDMEALVEDDERIMPGTAKATQDDGTVTVVARTMDGETTSQTVST